MGRKNKSSKTPSPYLFVALCSILGIVLGATASQAEINECITTANPQSACLNHDPATKRIEGMTMGLFAGAGAAIGATWRLWQKED